MFIEEGELRKYRSIRGKLYLIENESGTLKAYSLTPVKPSKEISHMFKPGKAKQETKRPLPDKWCGHEFSAEERCRLRVGESVLADDFVSRKTGKSFAAEILWNGASFDVHFPDKEKQNGQGE